MDFRYGNLTDYVHWRGDLPLDVCPLNEVDFLVLARIAYAPLTWLYLDEEEGFLPLSAIAEALLKRTDIHEHIHKEEDFLLYELLKDSKRFGTWELGGFADIFDVDRDLQFSAFVVRISEQLHVFVYRGTDDTMVGVKEDLNMTFQCPVEAQTIALRYFNEAAEALDGEFILCGHSKGGNLASYAASFCDYELQERIRRVYNFDGPGFDDMVLVTPQYQNICSRISTFVPQASMIGILLGHLEEHTVIHSHAQQMTGQHNIYTWDVDRDHFCYVEETTKESRYFDRTMEAWLRGLTRKQREEFVDAVFTIMERMNITMFSDLKKHWLTNSVALFQILGSIDEEDRKDIHEGLMVLMKSAWNNMDLRGAAMDKLQRITGVHSEFVDEEEPEQKQADLGDKE